MSSSDSKTASVTMIPVTKGGFPSIVNDAHDRALAAARVGGDALQAYYDSMNRTAEFWDFMARNSDEGQNPFVPGTDASGDPIMMASSGNVDMRMGVFYRGDTLAAVTSGGDDPPIVGIATVQTGNTTDLTSRTVSFGLSVGGLPPGMVLSKALFKDLLQPLYRNMKTWLTKNARNIQRDASDGEVDTEASADDAATTASDETVDVAGDLANQGVEAAIVDWSAALWEGAGLGALAALPLIISFMGHKMVTSVSIVNKTDFDFTWDVAYQAHGKTSVTPCSDDGKIISRMSYYTDIWGDRTSVKAAYEGNLQFINTDDLGSIGDVITLTPTSGAASVASLVVHVPWGDPNIIWVGEGEGSAESTYAKYTQVNGPLTMTAHFDAYSVTLAITKLDGETNGQYFYGVLAIIEPKGA